MRANPGKSAGRRWRVAVCMGAVAALGLALLGPATPGSAITPGQSYQQVRQFVVDGDNDLAVSSVTGDVYVAESNFDRIRRYAASGALLGSLDVVDVGGIDIGPQGWLYVVEDDRVRVYHPDLTPIGSFPVENIGITDIALNPVNGHAYVTDVVDDEVIHYDAGGNEQGRWGSEGSGDGQLDNPQAIAVGPTGDVYVGERWNNRISRFSATGAFLGKWGQLGTADGSFQWPHGLATDFRGNVFVADYADGGAQGGRIQVFTGTGVFLTSIGGFGAAPFPIFGPRDIDVDHSDRVHVITAGSPGNLVTTFAPAVTGAGRVKVVKPKGAVKLHGKRIRITLKCATGVACTGTATVTVKGKAVTKPKAYVVKAGKRKTITVKATKPGRKVLAKLAVTKAVVTVHGAARKIKIRR